MAKYIRSHSNYRLSTKYQETNSGTILERDISTVGGVDSFATGQATIYSSGNFVMTVNNTPSASRHVMKKGWLANSESGDTWNGEVLTNYTSDINGSVEKSILMKNDFMDLRSFACYGSLYSLVQSSVSDIIEKFPYEVYTGNDATRPVSYVSGFGLDALYEVHNPAGIDMHTTDISEASASLRYFTNGGYQNYEIHTSSEESFPFEWEVFRHNYRVVTSSDVSGGDTILVNPLSMLEVGRSKLFVITFATAVTASRVSMFGTIYPMDKSTFNVGDTIYAKVINNKFTFSYTYCPEPGDYVATIHLTYNTHDESSYTLKLYAVRDNELNVKYLTGAEDFSTHVRPMESLGYYDDFIDSLDFFQKCLMGVYSGKRNVAKFEVLSETDTGEIKRLETFVFPSGSGGYNLATDGMQMGDYIQRLARIGLDYDERYTDNMYRVMTHESLKNFDWTRNFSGNDNDYDNEYTESGEKFKSVIRIMGYVFDREKMYIDCISNTNTVTYNDRSNLPDYFLTDKLETDGWDVNTIYPFNLKEFDREGNEVSPLEWTEENQTGNTYTRKFSENTTELIKPYSYYEGAYYSTCDSDSKPVLDEVDDYGQLYHSDNGVVKNVIRAYHDDNEMTIPDVNNEFMKRLSINSRRIFSKKGTVEGIESLLGLFGFRSKRWYESLVTNNAKFINKYGANLKKKYPYDFDVQEYTVFAPPIAESWDIVNRMYQIDFYNSCKTIPYNTQSYINGIYIPYQGLPVAYRDDEYQYITAYTDTEGILHFDTTTDEEDTSICTDANGNKVHARRLYPNFESNGIYDGGMYYQMNGGWLNYWPYSYDTEDGLITNYSYKGNKETYRNVKQVRDLKELISQPSNQLTDGVIYYVNDLSTNYAIIDGLLYELYSEVDDSYKIQYYFKVTVQNGSVSIGNNLFMGHLVVSNPYTESGTLTINTQGNENGYVVKIYYMPDNEQPFTIYGYSDVTYYKYINDNGTMIEMPATADEYGAVPSYGNTLYAESTYVFINGSYLHNDNEYTHYFKLSDTLLSYLIASDGWYQLSSTDSDYTRISSIVDNYKGNNPHSGGDSYDNGTEYLSRFTKLFKYPLENGLFNDSCFMDIEDTYGKIEKIGFSGLTNESMTEYWANLHEDKKVHTFCDIIPSGTTSENDIIKYDNRYSSVISSKPDYAFVEEYADAVDGVTNQIVNTKIVDISFYLPDGDFYSKESQEVVKYIQSKVMPYVEQVLPSTIIPRIKYYIKPLDWIFEHSDEYDSSNYWTEDGEWPEEQ